MSRPTSKTDLLDVAEENFEKLWETIDSLTKEEFHTEFDFSSYEKEKEAHWGRDKNIRDILIHLYEWHRLAINWVKKNQEGKKTDFFPKPYTFKNYEEMNVGFWEKHQNTSFESAVELLKNSHKKTIKSIESFSNEELFTKKYFPWTDTTSLGSYMVSARSSHYDWAIKKIKAHKKIIGKKSDNN